MRKLSHLTQTAIGSKTVGFKNIVQQALQIKEKGFTNGSFIKPTIFTDVTSDMFTANDTAGMLGKLISAIGQDSIAHRIE